MHETAKRYPSLVWTLALVAILGPGVFFGSRQIVEAGAEQTVGIILALLMVLVIILAACASRGGQLLWRAWVALVGGVGGLVTFIAGSIPIADEDNAAIVVMFAMLVLLWISIGFVMNKAIKHKGPRPLSP